MPISIIADCESLKSSWLTAELSGRAIAADKNCRTPPSTPSQYFRAACPVHSGDLLASHQNASFVFRRCDDSTVILDDEYIFGAANFTTSGM